MPGYRKRRSGKSSEPVEPVAALLQMAIELRDPGDGHGTNWPQAAADLFKAAFHCVDQAEAGNEHAARVVRRAHDGAYNRLVGTPDSETPFLPEQSAPPSAGPAPGRAPRRPELNRRH